MVKEHNAAKWSKDHPNFQEFIETSQDLFWQCDLEGRLTYLNSAFENTFGYSIDEMLGQRFSDFYSPTQADRDEQEFARVLRGATLKGHETTCIGKAGNIIHLVLSAQCIHGDDGRVTGIRGTALDITERTSPKLSEDHFRKIVEQAPMAMSIVSMEGVIEFINRKAIEVFGFLPEEIPTMERWWIQAYPEKKYRERSVADWMGRVHKALSEGGNIIGNEYRVTCKDGTLRTCFISGVPVADKIFVMFDDITERKRAEGLLSIQHTLAHELNTTSGIEAWLETCLATALSASGMDCGGIYLVTEPDGHIELAVHKGITPAFAASTSHFDAQSPNGQLALAGQPRYSKYSLMAVPDHNNQFSEGIRAFAVIPVTFEGRVIACCNIGSHTYDDVPIFARTALETIAAHIGTGVARLKTEEALRRSNEKFSKIFKTSPDSIIISKLIDGTILEVNQSFTDLTGHTAQDVLGRTTLSGGFDLWVTEQDRINLVEGLKANGEVIGTEIPMRMKDGEIRTALVSARILEFQGEQCIVTIARDIHERKLMEEALLESERRYKMVSELTTDYIYKLGVAADNRVTMDFVSDNYYTLTGRTKQDTLTVEQWSDFICPDDLGAVTALLQQLITQPQSAELACRAYTSDRKLRWLSIIATSQWDEREQRVTGIVGAVKDITERKRAEQSIAAEKERLTVTLRSIGDGVITTDIHGCVDLMNKVAEKLTGWPWAEARGKPLELVFNIVDADTRMPRENPVVRVLSSGGIVELANQTLLVTRSGSELLIADSGAPIKDGEGVTVGVVVVFRDVTEKQKVVDAIQRTAKLESLGILAGGIAHDFNNLLTGIFGYIDLARSTCNNSETIEYLDNTISAMNRARALTLQLLTFAKGGAPIQKVISLTPFVQEAVQFALSGSNVACQFEFSPDLWACNVDKNQLGQVIDNVVINAQQAMPNGGAIEVTAKNVSPQDIENPALTKGNYVRLSVKDVGIGIPKDVMLRIFDPFYTTKTRGHGLGLATCHSIVNRHGGCIEVESEPGKGSTFHVFLPAATELKVKDEVEIRKHEGSGTIIVVDDEEIIRATVRKMLESIGYAVVCKNDGREAVDFYTSETNAGRTFTAVILDLTIPGGMGGVQAVAELRKIDKNIPLFVASGYADDPVMRSPGDYGINASLCKPFTIAELSGMLSENLKTL